MSVVASFAAFCSRKHPYKFLGPLKDHLAESYTADQYFELQWLAQEPQVLIPKPRGKRPKKTKTKTRGPALEYENASDVPPDDYLHLHAYHGKITLYKTSHVSTAGVSYLLSGTFDDEEHVQEAMEFMKNDNTSLVVTRRFYTSKNVYQDHPVALLCFTGSTKSVLYVSWAAVSKGQRIPEAEDEELEYDLLPTPSRDSQHPGYTIPDLPNGKPLLEGFDRLGMMSVLVSLMIEGTTKYQKLTTHYMFTHTNPDPERGEGALPFWRKMQFAHTKDLEQDYTPDPAHPVEKQVEKFRKYAEVQSSVKAGMAELVEMFKRSQQDGLSSYEDDGLYLLYCKHPNANKITLKPGLNHGSNDQNKPPPPPQNNRRSAVLKVVEYSEAHDKLRDQVAKLCEEYTTATTAMSTAKLVLQATQERLTASQTEQDAISKQLSVDQQKLESLQSNTSARTPKKVKEAEKVIEKQTSLVNTLKDKTDQLRDEAKKCQKQHDKAKRLSTLYAGKEGAAAYSDSYATTALKWTAARDAHKANCDEQEAAQHTLDHLKEALSLSKQSPTKTTTAIKTLQKQITEAKTTLDQINKCIEKETSELATHQASYDKASDLCDTVRAKLQATVLDRDNMFDQLIKARQDYRRLLPKDAVDGNLSDFSDTPTQEFTKLSAQRRAFRVNERRELQRQLGLSAALGLLATKTQYVTSKLPKAAIGKYDQHLGGAAATEKLYTNLNAKTDKTHFSIRDIVTRAHTYWKGNRKTHKLSPDQCLGYAQLEDFSFGITVDVNSYDEEDETVNVIMTKYVIPLLPKHPREWLEWLDDCPYDVDNNELPQEWEHKMHKETVFVQNVLRTANTERYNLIMDLIFGTPMLNLDKLTLEKDNTLVTQWDNTTIRELDFISPGSEFDIKLMPESLFGKKEKSFMFREKNKLTKNPYLFNRLGEANYIKTFGTLKDYEEATDKHVKHVRALGYDDEFIPPLPLYRYELSKFRWRPSLVEGSKDGYYEAMARIPDDLGKFIHIWVSMLTDVIEKQMFNDTDGKKFIKALKFKSNSNRGYPTQYRFVDLPPGDSREVKREKEAAAMAQVALLPTTLPSDAKDIKDYGHDDLNTTDCMLHEESHESERIRAIKALEAEALAEEMQLMEQEAAEEDKKRKAQPVLAPSKVKKSRQLALPMQGNKKTTASQGQVQVPALPSVAPPSHLQTSIPIKFHQGRDATCLVDSFSSALWQFGLTDAANSLQANYRSQLTQNNVRLIGDWISLTNQHYLAPQGLLLRRLSNIRSVEDTLLWDSSWPLVLLLNTSDGAEGQHSVTLYQDAIYEPNSQYTLYKTVEALNWAGGDNCICTDIFRAYQVLPRNLDDIANGPPTLYHVMGHGVGWVSMHQPQDVQEREDLVYVCLLTGERIKIFKRKLVPLLY